MRVLLGLVLVYVSGGFTFAQQAQIPTKRPAAAKFVDLTSALGVQFQYKASHVSKHYLIETMGSGVALFDYDNDGRLDIFLVNGAPLLKAPYLKKAGLPIGTGYITRKMTGLLKT
jgi:hypothetical protein